MFIQKVLKFGLDKAMVPVGNEVIDLDVAFFAILVKQV